MKYAIVGTVGVPGNYGGFETLAENLVRFHASHKLDAELSVYCSTKAFETRPRHFEKARLRYVRLDANGVQSVFYDFWSLFDAARRNTDVILLLGVSGALALPLMRTFSRCRIVTNIDGIEWKRAKWRGLARLILRLSERAAVRWSHEVIADNAAIATYVQETYGQSCRIIAYGGDHALGAAPASLDELKIPNEYAFALCRIEPENNVTMILHAFSQMPDRPLVFVGNWENSEYGRSLKARFNNISNLYLIDPVYDPGKLRSLRNRAKTYIHGHSAGGTNPSLVEMMHFSIPIIAHGCSFNRHTTEHQATYFSCVEDLVLAVTTEDETLFKVNAIAMGEVAARLYTWEEVGNAYYKLLENVKGLK